MSYIMGGNRLSSKGQYDLPKNNATTLQPNNGMTTKTSNLGGTRPKGNIPPSMNGTRPMGNLPPTSTSGVNLNRSGLSSVANSGNPMSLQQSSAMSMARTEPMTLTAAAAASYAAPAATAAAPYVAAAAPYVAAATAAAPYVAGGALIVGGGYVGDKAGGMIAESIGADVEVGKTVGGITGATATGAAVGACLGGPVGALAGAGIGLVGSGLWYGGKWLADNILFSKKSGNQRDTGLAGLSDEEVIAGYNNSTGKERKRYENELKARGLKNKQKRENGKRER